MAQAVTPSARVVYVDHDPVVLLHARDLLRGDPRGTTDYIEADLPDPAAIVRAAARTLDLGQPVAIVLSAVMHLITDDDDPYGIIGQLTAATAPGSYLVLSQVASDIEHEQVAQARRQYNQRARETQRHRTRAEVTRFFDGLDLIEPGVVPVQQWRPATDAEARAGSTMWCGVAARREWAATSRVRP